MLMVPRSQTFLCLVLPLLLLVGLTLGGFWLYSGPALALEAVQCFTPEPANCPASLDQGMAPFLGRSLVGLDYAQLPGQLRPWLPLYTIQQIKPQYPHQLAVTLSPRTPLFNLTSVSSTSSLQLDDDLVVLSLNPDATASALPSVNLLRLPALTVGDSVTDPDIVAAATLIKLLHQAQLPFTSLDLTAPPTIAVTFTQKPQALFTRLSDLSTAVASLQLIFASPTINLEAVAIIDVRFNKPVLKPHQ